MTKNINFVSHKKSKLKTNDGKPQLPSSSALVEGEIAINYAEDVETLSIKNESGTVVTFSSDNYYTEQKLGSAFTDNDVTVTDVTNSISGVANAAAVGVSSLKESKADLSAFTEHTASTVHMTETEKTNLDSLADNIEAISGITSIKIGQWDAAAGVDMDDYYQKSETSGASELSTAFDLKANDADLDAVSGTVNTHITNADIHVTTANKTAWDAKADLSDIPSVTGYADSVKYNSTSKEVEFYHGGTGGTKVFSYDASLFLIDGMVQNVEIKSVTSGESQVTCLVISFNTDAGKQDINIPISQIFDANNYYTTAQTDTAIEAATSGKVDNTTYTAYTAATATEIGNKLATSDFNTYSGAVDTSLNSKASQSDLNTLSGTVTGHTADSTIHVTSSDKSAWNAKVDSSDIANFFDDAKYEDSGTSKVINFYHGNTIKATIDADDFIKDGMISGVTLESKSGTTYLVINWNTDAGIETTELNIGDIFEADNYYTKSETSGKTEISTALGTKVNSATFTAHTADTSAHFSGDEKENLDSLATNIAAISGITSTNVNNWDTAATSAHNHSNKSTLDAITASSAAINSLTGTVGTMAFENVNSYSSATQVNTALSDKANSSDVYDKSETSGATELATEFALYTKKTDVDQVIDSGTSASTDAVSTSAVYGFVTAYTPSITVDQTIDSTTSASTNPVATKAVYSALTELNEVEVNSGDTPTSNSVELWVDESIDPVTVEVYTKAETNALLNDKSDKTATVSNVSYDSETGKLQKTINGTTTDVVSVVNSGFKFELNNGILNLIPIGTATAVVEDGILKLTF